MALEPILCSLIIGRLSFVLRWRSSVIFAEGKSIFLCQVNNLCFMYIICLIVFIGGCATLQYILSGAIQSCVLTSYCTATMNP